MAIIIKLSKRIEALGYKLGDKVEIIEEDLKCPLGLRYRCKSNKTYNLWFREKELQKE